MSSRESKLSSSGSAAGKMYIDTKVDLGVYATKLDPAVLLSLKLKQGQGSQLST